MDWYCCCVCVEGGGGWGGMLLNHYVLWKKKITLFRFTNLRVSIDFIKKQINYFYVFIIVLNAYLSHENSCVIKQW